MKGVVLKILEAVSDGTTLGPVPKSFLNYFIDITKDGTFLLQEHHFEFEIRRLKFNTFGAVQSMNPSRIKMIFTIFIIIRMLIHKIILRPTEQNPSLKLSEDDKMYIFLENCEIIAIVVI